MSDKQQSFVFLAVMRPVKSIADELEFEVIVVANSQQAIDMAVVLGHSYSVPAYVAIGPDVDRAAEIFANSALNAVDKNITQFKADSEVIKESDEE